MSLIRIMSHNVWNNIDNQPAWEAKGEDCSAAARAPGHARVYKETLPDIIGWQESTQVMCDLVRESCYEFGISYTVIFGRFTPIFYRSDKFELVDSSFLTYPERLEGFDGAFNDMRSKSCNVAVFRIKESGKIFVFATTHLWWKREDEETKFHQPNAYLLGSDKAREQQMAILIDLIDEYRKKYDCPAVIVGDFNTDYNSRAVSYTRAKGYRHAHDIATEYTDETRGYHMCFPWGYEKHYLDGDFTKAIDHIFVIGEEDGALKRFERYSPDYYFPISDHSAAFIDIEL